MRSRSSSDASVSAPGARGRILAAAARNFLARGFRSVTMDELAGELAMSKKTLYAHFRGKQAMLEAMLREKLRAAEADLAEITRAANVEFAGVLRQLLACAQRHLSEVRPAFLRDVQRECPELFQVVETRRREMVQRYLGKVLARGRRQGLVRRDVPLHLMMEILLAALEGIVNPPRLLELGLTPERGATAVLTVMLGGLLAREKSGAR
jgi:AcrR family transcriptional regulator